MPSAYEIASFAAAMRQADCADWLPAFQPAPPNPANWGYSALYRVYAAKPRGRSQRAAAYINQYPKGIRPGRYGCICARRDCTNYRYDDSLAAVARHAALHLRDQHGLRPQQPQTDDAKTEPGNRKYAARGLDLSRSAGYH